MNPSVGLPSEIIQMKGKDFARKMTPQAVLYQGKAFFHFNTFIYGLYMCNEYSLFQALGSWGQAKMSEKKNEGGLRQEAAGEPVRISLTTLFWYSWSCYTL